MTSEEIKEKYRKLIQDVKSKDFYKIDLTNRVNCYTCTKCGHITKTIDIDAGVTPFMSSCEKCKEIAQSSFFEDLTPNMEPTIEWYRPNLKEVLGMIGKKYNTIDHILQGGLIDRKIVIKKELEYFKKQGLLPKYILSKTSGKPLHPKSKYFVLRYDTFGSDPIHLSACRKALGVYAEEIKDHLPLLSKDLKKYLN